MSRAAGTLLPNKQGVTRNVLVESRKPQELVKQLGFSLPLGEGRGEQGLLQTMQDVLQHSVNTWDQGFLDKLYASTNAVSSMRAWIDSSRDRKIRRKSCKQFLTRRHYAPGLGWGGI